MTRRALVLVVASTVFVQVPGGATGVAVWSDTPVRWGDALSQPAEWYGSAEARTMAHSVIAHQSPHGGWPKNTDLAVPPPADAPADARRFDTIDNGATTTPMRFLARVVHATGEARSRESFERGLRYLHAAQYPNGGWPQYYPLRAGYYSRITYNDDAMVNVLALLREVGGGEPPYAFVGRDLRERAHAAVDRGIDVILRTQIRRGDQLTAWCAQHDEVTLAPAWGRAYEPPSLSGSESVGIVRFLMGVERPSPDIVDAVESAVAWFEAVAISGLRYESFTDAEGHADRRVVEDVTASRLWARFYELGTHRPIFLGRDSAVRDHFGEIERERRTGYAYYGTWPASLLERDYPRWRDRLAAARRAAERPIRVRGAGGRATLWQSPPGSIILARTARGVRTLVFDRGIRS